MALPNFNGINHEAYDAAETQRFELAEQTNQLKLIKIEETRQQKIADGMYITEVLSTVTPGPKGEACNGKPELFYGVDGENTKEKKLRVEAAKVVCNLCIIRADCLEDALSQENSQGIWGGMTVEERRRYANKRRWS